MARLWFLLAIASISALFLDANEPATAGYLCYMRDNNGKIIDLSASVCGSGATKPQPTVDAAPVSAPIQNRNDAFWDDFTKSLSDPTTLQTVDVLGQSAITDLAQAACQLLQNGQPMPEPKEQANATRYPASFFEAVNTAAANSLCPELKPKPEAP